MTRSTPRSADQPSPNVSRYWSQVSRRPPTSAPNVSSTVALGDAARPCGYQRIADWARYERWMRANGLLKQPASATAPLTNDFLPGEWDVRLFLADGTQLADQSFTVA